MSLVIANWKTYQKTDLIFLQRSSSIILFFFFFCRCVCFFSPTKQDGSCFIAQTKPKAFSVEYGLFCPEVKATTG